MIWMSSSSRHHRGAANRRGISLLEVTIGSMMVAVLTLMASSVAVDMSRHMTSNIKQTQVLGEARLAIETLRRDFGGTSLDDPTGDRASWRLVGRMIPTQDELRLCFDADQDASADWAMPDRIVAYTVADNRLIRTDFISGNSFTVARYVEDVNFSIVGNDIVVTLDLELADFSDTYTFVTADIP